MTTIKSITASYTIKTIFGSNDDVESTVLNGGWMTKKLITKLITGFFRPYWEQGHVNHLRVELSDDRVLCICKAVQGVKQLEVTIWDGFNKDTSILPARVVSADLREMVEEQG